ncbi:hypothetical protein F2Q69_00049298 [Brassica cretica]|uniref:Uncharacterized protein n=1 Tax=Brassica cretica TaxID=69181 RepID=A0A8S9PYM5_BRACR|nr:hypothetical protein F2Q69_00049298 [Brassica cretica]
MVTCCSASLLILPSRLPVWLSELYRRFSGVIDRLGSTIRLRSIPGVAMVHLCFAIVWLDFTCRWVEATRRGSSSASSTVTIISFEEFIGNQLLWKRNGSFRHPRQRGEPHGPVVIVNG